MQTDISIKRPVLKLIKSVFNIVNKAFTFDENVRHIDDEKFQVPVEASKKLITNILLIWLLMLAFSASLQIIIISQTFKGPKYHEISKVEGEGHYFREMVTYGMYLVFQDGTVYNFEWRGKNGFIFENKTKLSLRYSFLDDKFPICGYFPIFHQNHLNVFLGAKGTIGKTYDMNFAMDPLANSTMLHEFNLDATFIQVGKYAWLFGGSSPCEYPNIESNWRGSNGSQIWSLSKQKWTPGPSYPKGYFSLNSCAIALNSTAVLVIGLIPVPSQAFDEIYKWNHIGTIPNPATLIYNFQSKSWVEQDSVPYAGYPWEYFYDYSCQVVHEKNRKRILAMTNLVSFGGLDYNHKQYAWISEFDEISWRPLTILNPKLYTEFGTIFTLRGMLYYFLPPNIGSVLGYRINLGENSLEYIDDISINGLKPCGGTFNICSELRDLYHPYMLKHIHKQVKAVPYYKRSPKKKEPFTKFLT